jgi:hypothetical protein
MNCANSVSLADVDGSPISSFSICTANVPKLSRVTMLTSGSECGSLLYGYILRSFLGKRFIYIISLTVRNCKTFFKGGEKFAIINKYTHTAQSTQPDCGATRKETWLSVSANGINVGDGQAVTAERHFTKDSHSFGL